MANEPMPAKEVIDELNSQWNASNVTEPNYIVVTGASENLRYDLNKGDYIIARPGNPEIEEIPIGNHKYGDRIYAVDLELYTNDSRQRLYNLMQEVRRICHARRHSLTNFQRIIFESFFEDTDENVNVWSGSIGIELENNSVLLET
tara:strand:- start:51 stop:488 length:438 start_codon:yes stop_codon:yes gene_type:complete